MSYDSIIIVVLSSGCPQLPEIQNTFYLRTFVRSLQLAS